MKIENLLEKPLWQMTGQEFLALNEQTKNTVQNLESSPISENTLKGEHISEYKQRQINQQIVQEPAHPDDAKLKPMEP